MSSFLLVLAVSCAGASMYMIGYSRGIRDQDEITRTFLKYRDQGPDIQ